MEDGSCDDGTQCTQCTELNSLVKKYQKDTDTLKNELLKTRECIFSFIAKFTEDITDSQTVRNNYIKKLRELHSDNISTGYRVIIRADPKVPPLRSLFITELDLYLGSDMISEENIIAAKPDFLIKEAYKVIGYVIVIEHIENIENIESK